MTKEEFLTEMLEVLQRDEPIDMGTPLADIDEWDSLAIMGTAAFLNHHFSVHLGMDEFKKLSTIGDIAKAAGIAV